MENDPIKITVSSKDDFAGRVVRLHARLGDHIERLDSGIGYAVDDLAAVMRVFIGRGTGNNILNRLVMRSQGDAPRVTCSKGISNENASFAFGSVPIHDYEPVTEHGARIITIDEWVKSRVLTVTTPKGRRHYTWRDFVTEFAHKWGGVHLDNDLPDSLKASDRFATAGYDLSSYLLRSAAVEVWRIVNRLFADKFVFPGDKNEVQQIKESFRVQCPGASGADPADIANRGALQWFEFDGKEADFLYYYPDGVGESSFIIALNGWPYEFRVKPLNPFIKSDQAESREGTTSVQSHYTYRLNQNRPLKISELVSVKVVGRSLRMPRTSQMSTAS